LGSGAIGFGLGGYWVWARGLLGLGSGAIGLRGSGAIGLRGPGARAAEPALRAAEPASGAAEPALRAAEPASGAAEPAVRAAEPASGAAEPASGAAEPGCRSCRAWLRELPSRLRELPSRRPGGARGRPGAAGGGGGGRGCSHRPRGLAAGRKKRPSFRKHYFSAKFPPLVISVSLPHFRKRTCIRCGSRFCSPSDADCFLTSDHKAAEGNESESTPGAARVGPDDIITAEHME
jgi:hypothetical protein